ncbi:MAG: hypothetical protein Kow0081_4440 [Candidatus Dojkabacteria bacterium]
MPETYILKSSPPLESLTKFGDKYEDDNDELLELYVNKEIGTELSERFVEAVFHHKEFKGVVYYDGKYPVILWIEKLTGYTLNFLHPEVDTETYCRVSSNKDGFLVEIPFDGNVIEADKQKKLVLQAIEYLKAAYHLGCDSNGHKRSPNSEGEINSIPRISITISYILPTGQFHSVTVDFRDEISNILDRMSPEG